MPRIVEELGEGEDVDAANWTRISLKTSLFNFFGGRFIKHSLYFKDDRLRIYQENEFHNECEIKDILILKKTTTFINNSKGWEIVVRVNDGEESYRFLPQLTIWNWGFGHFRRWPQLVDATL